MLESYFLLLLLFLGTFSKKILFAFNLSLWFRCWVRYKRALYSYIILKSHFVLIDTKIISTMLAIDCFMSPQIFICWIPNSQWYGNCDKTLERYFRRWHQDGGALMWNLYECTEENSSLCHMRKVAIWTPRRELLPQSDHTSTLTSYFQPPECDKYFSLFNPAGLWYLLWQPKICY